MLFRSAHGFEYVVVVGGPVEPGEVGNVSHDGEVTVDTEVLGGVGDGGA